MTLQDVINHVNQNMANLFRVNEILDGDQYISDAVNLYVLPRLVTMHDWSWKYVYVDIQLNAGIYKFTPSAASLGSNILIDDLDLVILLTGNLGTTDVVEQINRHKFLQNFPDPSIEPRNRPSVCMRIGAPGDTVDEIWFNCPLDIQRRFRLFFAKTFGTVTLAQELPFRYDKHMLIIQGVTAYCYASFEKYEAAAPFEQMFLDGVEMWWKQDQDQGGLETTLGFFKSRRAQSYPDTEYWKDPFVRRVE